MRVRQVLGVLGFFWALGASGDVDLRLLSPRESFELDGVANVITNDPVLRLEGEIRSEGGEILLSIETPGGIPRLDTAEIPIRLLTLDLGQTPRDVVGLTLTPFILENEGRSFGVRTLSVSASLDGRTFDTPRVMNVPSGIETPDRNTHIRFPASFRATLLRLEFLEGWQRNANKPAVPDIRLIRVGVLGKEGVVPSAVTQVGAVFPANPYQPFQFSVRLKEGKNHITVTALQQGRPEVPLDRRSDVVTLLAIWEPELPRREEEPFVLSDGSHLVLRVPTHDETLRAIRFEREAPEAVAPASYASNRDIRAGSRPILVYRFAGRYQTAFHAEATASLPGQPPSLAVDGRREFPSTWVSNLAPMPIHWRVDLGEEVVLGKIVLYARKEGSLSYAPRQARLRVSVDGETYVPVVAQIGPGAASETLTTFNDTITTILLPTTPLARWIELIVLEGKQPNNVQINEIEFFDASGGRVLASREVPRVLLGGPARVALRYDEGDLAEAGASPDAPLGIFLWHEATGEWEWTRTRSYSLAGKGGYFTFDVNVLTRLALFELSPSARVAPSVPVRWNPNPFSPNGDGIADTTRLTVQFAMSPASPPEVTVHLYDLRGMLVKTLSDGAVLSSNALVIEWDGRDRDSRPVPTGAYVYEVLLNDASRNRRTLRNGILVVVR